MEPSFLSVAENSRAHFIHDNLIRSAPARRTYLQSHS